jgi:glycerophosphoryl diester phosphodiesterase
LKKILNIGHRGAKGHEPENTLPSFQKALDLNADGIELDVHVCKTGELIVIHDFTVDRTTNGSGTVSELSLSEIKSLRINGDIKIPTLEEVLELVGKKCLINIELKGRHTAKPVSHLIEKYILEGDYSYDDFIVSSFQREELEMIFSINPKIHLGVLSQASVTQALEWANTFSAKAIHPHFSLLTEENVKKAQAQGFKVYTWTVNETEDIERIKTYNVNGIITDFPEKI